MTDVLYRRRAVGYDYKPLTEVARRCFAGYGQSSSSRGWYPFGREPLWQDERWSGLSFAPEGADDALPDVPRHERGFA